MSQFSILLLYYSLCFLFHLLLTVMFGPHNFRNGVLSPIFLPFPQTLPHSTSNVSLLRFCIIQADNYIQLCKHNCLLCLIENLELQISYLYISFVHHRANIMGWLYFFLDVFQCHDPCFSKENFLASDILLLL